MLDNGLKNVDISDLEGFAPFLVCSRETGLCALLARLVRRNNGGTSQAHNRWAVFLI